MKVTKNIIINIQRLKITPLNLNHILTLIKIQFYTNKNFLNYIPTSIDILFLLKNKYIVKSDNKTIKYYLREKGKLVINTIVKLESEKYENKIIIKDISNKDIIEDFNNFVNSFRALFKGLKVGSMGNPNAVKDKLERWMKFNPEATRTEIIEAVKTYIESLNGDYRYLQRADYFIYKQNLRKEEVSRLSLFIDENRKEVVNSDWTTTLT